MFRQGCISIWQCLVSCGILTCLPLRPCVMFSDSSSSNENVCVIKRSIFEHPARPIQSYLAEFVREVCGSIRLNEFSSVRPAEASVAACVWCPPISISNDQVRPSPASWPDSTLPC